MKLWLPIILLLGCSVWTQPGFAVAEEVPLPSMDSVLDHVLEHASHEGEIDQQFKRLYSYTRSRVTEEYSPSGKLKERKEKTGKNNPQPPVEPSASVPGKPASQSKPVPGSKGTNGVPNRAFDTRDFPLDKDLLRRFDFTLAGRESLDGRSVLVVDFKPASRKLPVRDIRDTFVNRTAGRVWVDEQDFAVVKADLHLTERVSVVGGLVGAVWKFRYGFERARTPEGLWFTRNLNWRLEGREFVVKKVIEYHEQKTDVRKAW